MTVLIEGIEVDPASVFGSDSNYHHIIDSRVNRCGKKPEEGFLKADLSALFTEQEREQRHHRSG